MIRSITTFSCFICLLLSGRSVKAEELEVARFGVDGINGWEVREFKGQTSYQLVPDGQGTVLKAQAKGTASGLVKKMSFDTSRHRYLKWSWKIDQTIATGDETSRQGDDYAARIYIIFPGRFFWQTRALNYIWANKLPREQFVPNAFTANAMLLAVESGMSRAGQWLAEERDILADYRRVFGAEPPRAGGVAIMTDADNTGTEATAWYGDITLSTTR